MTTLVMSTAAGRATLHGDAIGERRTAKIARRLAEHWPAVLAALRARGPRLVEGLAVVLMAWQLALVILEVRRPLRDVTAAATEARQHPRQDARPRFDESALAQLVGAHLFGEVPPAPAAPAIAPSSLQLVGIFLPEDRASTAPASMEGEGDLSSASSAEPAERGESDSAARIAQELAALQALWGAAARAPAPSGVPIAWIKEAGGTAARVTVGEPFAGGTVKAIEATAVMLTLGGQDVRIMFPENPFIAMFRGEPTDPGAIARAIASAPSAVTEAVASAQPIVSPSSVEPSTGVASPMPDPSTASSSPTPPDVTSALAPASAPVAPAAASPTEAASAAPPSASNIPDSTPATPARALP